ncbi:hypothetical protein RND71_002914 [Anisodus tanguticus]|uniref:Uncharacterized protein n=1 Tax=Anisodus tanguticus TaxID=243964 RepID=A0AAE1SSD6_9SOLA|nr:hypothetical protein RND71_002914 [Anisodus tanguticus]
MSHLLRVMATRDGHMDTLEVLVEIRLVFANAGFLSGSTGIESVPGPELLKIDFLNRWNDDNHKRYAELDAKFKDSPLLKQLLEKSKQNKEKNENSIQDKYCLRGAEWGVGDCSTAGMTPEERDSFIAMLKQKAGVE